MYEYESMPNNAVERTNAEERWTLTWLLTKDLGQRWWSGCVWGEGACLRTEDNWVWLLAEKKRGNRELRERLQLEIRKMVYWSWILKDSGESGIEGKGERVDLEQTHLPWSLREEVTYRRILWNADMERFGGIFFAKWSNLRTNKYLLPFLSLPPPLSNVYYWIYATNMVNTEKDKTKPLTWKSSQSGRLGLNPGLSSPSHHQDPDQQHT